MQGHAEFQLKYRFFHAYANVITDVELFIIRAMHARQQYCALESLPIGAMSISQWMK